MSSKTVMLSGTLISALFMYYCINSKKDEVYAMINPEAQIQTPAPQIENTPSIEEQIPQDTAQIAQNQPVVQEVLPIVDKKEIIFADPSFVFMNTKPLRFVSFLSEKDKNSAMVEYIENLCQTKECIKEAEYFDNRNLATWQSEVKELLKYQIENNIQSASITVNNNNIKIEGEVSNESQKIEIQKIAQRLVDKNFKIEDLTTTVKSIIPIVEEDQNITTSINTEEITISNKPEIQEAQIPIVQEIKTQEIETPEVQEVQTQEVQTQEVQTQEVQTQEVQTQKIIAEPVYEKELSAENIRKNSISIEEEMSVQDTKTIEDIQPIQNTQIKQDIGNMLNLDPITFENRGNIVSQDGKIVLDKIIELVQSNGVTNIEIMGYENSSDDLLFSKIMGQKKADTVKKYLKEHGISVDIKSIGVGKDDSKQQEIEIILKKGN